MTSLTTRLAESARAFAGSFSNPALRRLQLAFVGSEIGGWGYTIALMVLVFDEGGAAALGVLTLVIMLAPGIAAPFTGILGDRFDRIRVMVAADLVRVVLMAAAAAVAFAGAPSEILYALAALSSVAGTAFRPAQAAVLPSLARTPEELTAANVASSTIESAGAFAGPALAGVIVALTDPGVSFAVAAGTFLWSAALLNGIRTRDRVEDQTEHTEPESIPEVVTAGARAVVTDPGARIIVSLVSAQTFVSGTLLVFLPVLALDLLDWGEEGFGAVNAALGIGGIVGAVAAVTLVGVRRLSRPLAIGTLLWGAPIALAAAWDTKAGALVLFGIVGLANTIVDVSAYTMLQRAVPDACSLVSLASSRA